MSSNPNYISFVMRPWSRHKQRNTHPLKQLKDHHLPSFSDILGNGVIIVKRAFFVYFIEQYTTPSYLLQIIYLKILEFSVSILHASWVYEIKPNLTYLSSIPLIMRQVLVHKSFKIPLASISPGIPGIYATYVMRAPLPDPLSTFIAHMPLLMFLLLTMPTSSLSI